MSSKNTGQVRDSDNDSANSQDQSEESQVDGAEAQQEEAQQSRSKRTRTLTEKGREMQATKIKSLQQRFNYIYVKWRTHVKSSKRTLLKSVEALSDDLLNDIIGDVISLSSDVQRVYDDLRKISTPDQDMRRRVDLCVEISNFVVSKASSRLDGKIPEGEEQDWPEAGSLFNPSTCKSSSFSSILNGASEHSSRSSVKRQEAAAEAAASEAVLEVLQEQNKEQLEIQLLEAQVKKKIADQEAAAVKRRLEQEAEEVRRRIKREEEEVKIKAQLEEEHVALQKALEDKRRRIQHLEAIKGLNAARAKLKVYDEEKVIDTDHKDFLEISPVPQAVITSSNESTAELV